MVTSAVVEPAEPAEETESAPAYSLGQIVAYAARLGSIGFGGPAALVGYMHRDLVEQRRWISEADYKEGLALAQLAPGPLAAQLMIYLGYVHYGVVGATVVGIAFVLPSFLMVLGLGWAYVQYGGLPWMQAVFYGVGASVIGIIAFSTYKLSKKSIGRRRLLWAIFAISAAVTVITEAEMVWLFVAAGVVNWLVVAPPKALSRPKAVASVTPLPLVAIASGGVPVASAGTLGQVFLYFAKAGTFVFGSGLAIVPFLYAGVVKEHAWLTDHQFTDAVAVAMITPGPVVITTGFIGFLIGGFTGATVAAVATFLPCYLLTILPAPYFKRYGKLPGIAAFVDGVTAAAIGAIGGAVVVLGKRSIVDVPTALLAVVTLVLLLRAKRLPEPVLILGAAVVGLVLSRFGRI